MSSLAHHRVSSNANAPHYAGGNIQRLFDNNRKWVEESLKDDPEFFEKLKKGQSPEYLYIGCADSRVPAQELMGLKCGQCFVARNIANLVIPTDLSLLSVLEYAIHVLEVPDILVVGHYGCGGVKAAMTQKDHGLIETWIHAIRDVWRMHKPELEAIEDEDSRWRRMVELNVQESCMQLFTNPIVQRKQATCGVPRIHGFVYDIGDGFLKKLDIDFRALYLSNQEIYELHEFQLGGDKPGKSANFLTGKQLEDKAAHEAK